MKKVVCPYCGFGCKLLIDPATLKVKPYKGEPNKGKLCPKGLYSTEIVKSRDRLKRPLKRVGSKIVPISWGQAMEEISNKLLEVRELYGPDAVAFLASSKVSNEENYLLQKIARLFGTNNIDNCARLCHEASVHALKLAVGTGAQTNPYEDIPKFKSVLIWGYNPAETHPVVMDYILRAKKSGAKIIVVDVRETRTMAFADHRLIIRPGTDIVLANALAHVIIEEELYNEEFIRSRTTGFSEVRMAVKKYTPEYAERATGVPAEKIKEVARDFSLAGSGAEMWGMGLTQHVSGVENVLALINLALLLGYIGERGGLYPMRGQNNVQGAAYMGALSEFLPGYVPLTDGKFRKRVAGLWGVDDLPTERGLYLTELWDAIEKGDVRALYIVGENPAVSEADFMRVRRALRNLDLLVVQDIFPTRTARYAHYLLPASAFCEKAGSYMNSERRIQWSEKVCEPAYDSKPDWEILTMLGKALGLPGFNYTSVEEITAEYFRLFPELEEKSVEELKNSDGIFLPKKRLHTWEFATPDGKARFMAVEWIPPWEGPDDKYPFVLTTVRLIGHYNTGEMTLRSPSLVRLMGEPKALISREDAERLGIQNGDWVEVETRRGKIRMTAEIGDVPQGVIAVPFHFKANKLTSHALNKAGTPEFKFAAARVRKV
ncbi:probable formate dehydrogenase, alpha subunit [Thermococcus kodakarensis KOD1]|uniref:Probable formate dehydrogenase, alpha subunit n=1 Tax=Thermococcus kodakarensis (strain ATCC BAA-918 / JCM 12380 / KOD1) TaxID=69014 RepID=Q5JFR4_THEKO|nr:formate dehydrogenase subunit alpha [Thermococcus kodakarensis]WCN28304.1 formate dehydrogenase subunit alpha [Thermococcus kodakarensis]WCN30599.1 formate dehydrogenase subunit alpha [Thermococcus kodakarensis]BAD84403.1 probable formate dehydrogenase, alpha subunit [Thermococcus kodakarensis KOD1]